MNTTAFTLTFLVPFCFILLLGVFGNTYIFELISLLFKKDVSSERLAQMVNKPFWIPENLAALLFLFGLVLAAKAKNDQSLRWLIGIVVMLGILVKTFRHTLGKLKDEFVQPAVTNQDPIYSSQNGIYRISSLVYYYISAYKRIVLNALLVCLILFTMNVFFVAPKFDENKVKIEGIHNMLVSYNTNLKGFIKLQTFFEFLLKADNLVKHVSIFSVGLVFLVIYAVMFVNTVPKPKACDKSQNKDTAMEANRAILGLQLAFYIVLIMYFFWILTSMENFDLIKVFLGIAAVIFFVMRLLMGKA